MLQTESCTDACGWSAPYVGISVVRSACSTEARPSRAMHVRYAGCCMLDNEVRPSRALHEIRWVSHAWEGCQTSWSNWLLHPMTQRQMWAADC